MPLFKYIYIYIVSVFCVPLSLYTLQCNIISLYVHSMYLSVFIYSHTHSDGAMYIVAFFRSKNYATRITEHQCYLPGIF